MLYPNGHIIYKLYENGIELPGVVKVTGMAIKYKQTTSRGAGIMGDINIPLCGMIDAMTVSMEFSSHDALVRLGTNEWHDIQIYDASQHFDAVTRTEELRAARFEMAIRPTEIDMGDIETYKEWNAKASFSMCQYAVYVDDVEQIFIDQLNIIHRINGKDSAALLRKAIGMV
ncbi:MAG: hypothetical protein HFF08_10295 [Oscillospiraceae bacterium]|nr:hypothetical protein [Oscillospiraceae bacterium]